MTFLRRITNRYSRIGLRRKRKQVWRRPTGRDNKMREKRNGRPPVVSIGYRQNRKIIGKIAGRTPITIYNTEDLKKVRNDNIAILGKVGRKNKVKIAKMAQELKVEIYNLNPKIFLSKINKSAVGKAK
ncbi:hypothetical protein HYT23_03155 [Candidatus Pacearchaeota archaeon]|nr:hypothetical protein [Candidatus Pacearchaeota archaeon]